MSDPRFPYFDPYRSGLELSLAALHNGKWLVNRMDQTGTGLNGLSKTARVGQPPAADADRPSWQPAEYLCARRTRRSDEERAAASHSLSYAMRAQKEDL